MKSYFKNFFFAVSLFSVMQADAQIDNLSNMSPEWVRCASRNASFDGTDAVIYNPAGLTKLKSGFHLTIGNQSLLRKPSHTYDLGYGPQKREQDGNDLIEPDILFSYNKDKWAIWGGAYISAGGGTANFPAGSINTDLISGLVLQGAQGAYSDVKDQRLKASSVYFTGTAGVSFEANEALSFAFGVRYINAKYKTEAGTTLTSSLLGLPDAPLAIEFKDDATGFAGVLGIHATPCENFNISIRLESQAKLNFKTDSIKDEIGLIADGTKHHRDLPAVFGIGMGYNFSDKFRASAEMSYYFQTLADWGNFTDVENLASTAGDALTYAACFEYKFFPKFTWSLGTMYSVFDWQDKGAYYTSLGAFETSPGNNVTINTGFAVNFSEKLRLNLGVAKAFYEKDKKVKALAAYPFDVDVTVNNDALIIGAGVDILF